MRPFTKAAVCMNTPLSLYFHIPFCAHKCGYCDFYSHTKLSQVSSFVSSLKREIALAIKRFPEIKTRPIATIFFGGGTPSILSADQFKEVGRVINDTFDLSELAEWSIEVNPESFTVAKARAWLDTGVTRLSVGVQSLDTTELKVSERIHSATTALEVFTTPILMEFDSVSADTIYGLPNQTEASLAHTLTTLTALPVIQHISSYELTIAEGTPFEKKQESLALPREEKLERLTALGRSIIAESGFERYEVSNFARNGKISHHNMTYWNGAEYLGFGPSAHSYYGGKRWGNSASQKKWEETLATGVLAYENSEEITVDMQLEEFLMLRLRTAQGFLEREFQKLFGESFESDSRRGSVAILMEQGYLKKVDSRWFLSDSGLDRADGIALMLL